MKETPQEKKIRQNLQESGISPEGFLGDDKRHVHEIVATDLAVLERLGKTKEEIADRMQYFTQKAFSHYDGNIIIDQIYEIEYNTVRGKIPCPFDHPGLFRKGEITLKNLKKNLEISWTPLNIHMIRAHGFFEGKKAKHRLEPKNLVEILFK